ncbi:hypothetical protein [Brevundimonas mediterranea]|nr:hypothetical protein [Brevundimonas mediterranea]
MLARAAVDPKKSDDPAIIDRLRADEHLLHADWSGTVLQVVGQSLLQR